MNQPRRSSRNSDQRSARPSLSTTCAHHPVNITRTCNKLPSGGWRARGFRIVRPGGCLFQERLAAMERCVRCRLLSQQQTEQPTPQRRRFLTAAVMANVLFFRLHPFQR